MLSMWAISLLSKWGRHASFPRGFVSHPLSILCPLICMMSEFLNTSLTNNSLPYIYADITALTMCEHGTAKWKWMIDDDLGLNAFCVRYLEHSIVNMSVCMMSHFPISWLAFIQGVLVSASLEFVDLPGTSGTRLNIRIINLSTLGWQCLDREEVEHHPVPYLSVGLVYAHVCVSLPEACEIQNLIYPHYFSSITPPFPVGISIYFLHHILFNVTSWPILYLTDINKMFHRV